jgi:polysaccharide chain length determinant protein (PEP-CTERM system associated)
METSYITDLIKAFARELINLKEWAVGLFLLAVFAILVLGFFWPKSYETSALLSADVSNIIAPLLEGKAAVRSSVDRSQQARELIYTRRIIEAAARRAGLLTGNESVDAQEAIIAGLRSSVKIQTEGPNYFRILYSNSDPDRSFQVLNAVVDVFIEDAAQRRQAESRSAFEFIDEQVNSYKRQLQAAEDKLKTFRSGNIDGTERSAANRISQLQMQIEELKIAIDESHARERSIQEQLQNESQYLAAKGQIDAYRERLHSMQTQLDSLRLSYQDSYPDVVSLRQQIDEMRSLVQRLETEGGVINSGQSAAENPLYEDLRKQLASNETALRSQHRRLQVLEGLLEQEFERAKRIAGNQAEVSELTRDYNVTKQIYEDMLASKEKARLSMTLDVEGQGVNYRIQEPARFPVKPSGLRFIHFALAGPFVALLIPVGLIVAYIVLDPRIRSVTLMASSLPPDVELLGVVPHMRTPVARRVLQGDVIRLGIVVALALAAYIGIATARLMGNM